MRLGTIDKAIAKEPLFDLEGFTYNPETGEIKLHGKPMGGVSSKYIRVCRKGVRVMAHRLAWRLQTGNWPRRMIDHVNRNRTDNRFENLREADDSQNTWNSERNLNPFGERGISFHHQNKKWAFKISHRGKRFHFCASHKISAIVACRLTRRLLHGEFTAEAA